mmetsp:Transcript_3075/g.11925  ORF Transcript_3075/g.11925 Transcript_3075/m.11925 type:complete len:767 (+) Transcript_3075:361-2661(+)
MADLARACVLVLEVMLQGLRGEDLQGAHELELEIDVPQVHPGALGRAEVPQVRPKAVREKNCVGINLDRPVVLQVPAIRVDLVPSSDECVDVVDGRRITTAERTASEESMVVALRDSTSHLLCVVGQLRLGAPEGLSGALVPADHGEAEEGGALHQHALRGLRHLARAHVAEDSAIPTTGRGAGLARSEELVLFPAGVPLELSELPIRHRHICTALAIDAILSRPSASTDRRNERLHLEDSVEHVHHGVELGRLPAKTRVEGVLEGERLAGPGTHEVAATALGGEDGLPAVDMPAAPVAALLGRRDVPFDHDCRQAELLALRGGHPHARQVQADAPGCDLADQLRLGGHSRAVLLDCRLDCCIGRIQLLLVVCEPLRPLVVLRGGRVSEFLLGILDVVRRSDALGGLLLELLRLGRVGLGPRAVLISLVDLSRRRVDLVPSALVGRLSGGGLGLQARLQGRGLGKQVRGVVGLAATHDLHRLLRCRRHGGNVAGLVTGRLLCLQRLVVALIPGVRIPEVVVSGHPAVAARSVHNAAVGATRLVAEEAEVVHGVHTEAIQAGLHVEVLACLGELLRDAGALTTPREVELQGLPRNHLNATKELPLVVNVLEVDFRALRGPKVCQVHLENVREEDSINIDLHSPVVLCELTGLLDLAPVLDEGIGVHVGGPRGLGDLPGRQDGAAVALEDAQLLVLAVIGHRSLLLGPHRDHEAEQGRSLNRHAIEGLGHGAKLPATTDDDTSGPGRRLHALRRAVGLLVARERLATV